MVRFLIAAFGGAWLFGGVVLMTLAYGGVRHTDLCAPRAEFGDVAGLWPREAEEFGAAIAGRSQYLETVDHRDGNRIRSVRVERNTVTVALDGPNHWRTPETPGAPWQLIYARHHGGVAGGGLPCVKIDVASSSRVQHWAWAAADLNVLR
ncbi:MAG: hypothetical protein QOF71_1140 [Candidatus Eremiobacteraeota bacterium]|nr:hypothetical protein [Candidatus Eremiobacteraeota bacterium]